MSKTLNPSVTTGLKTRMAARLKSVKPAVTKSPIKSVKPNAHLVVSKRHLSQQGGNLLKDIEQLRLKPYDDDTGKEITSWLDGATIGYGYLIPKHEWTQFKEGITTSHAEVLFREKLQPFVNQVNKNLQVGVSQHQFDALVILAYNIGVSGFANSSVVTLINDPAAKTDYPTLESAWKAWKKSDGVENSGLINRRQSEWDIYTKGIYKRW